MKTTSHSDAPPDQLRGVLETIRFQRGRFLIGQLADGETVVGESAVAQVGLEYTFVGRWENSVRWGPQFKFEEAAARYPTSLQAVRSYLQENAKWIGPEISGRLVDEFGEKTLQVCKDQPETVAVRIKGITPDRAREIQAMLRQNEAAEKLDLEIKNLLVGVTVSRRAVARMIELWGEETPARIRENAYQLIKAVKGIGFLTADRIATNIGCDPAGPARLRAGILHVLKESAQQRGHVCLPKQELLTQAEKLLRVVHYAVEGELPPMAAAGLLVEENGWVYLPELYEAEQTVARKIGELASQSLPVGEADLTGLAPDQQAALKDAVTAGVFILTGAPGTGKTFTIQRVISSFPGAEIALAAPTGKAAKRIQEQTRHAAQTIHKLLMPKRVGDRFVFTRNAGNPIPADLIVLDEVSMIDVHLMAQFLAAVATGTRLILVGDTHQLPSVGAGNVLGDLIKSGLVPCVELTEIKRQDEGLIIKNCHRVKNGQNILLENSSAQDFFFLKRQSERDIQDAILDLVSERLPQTYGIDPLRDVQIITPLRERGQLSCKALNTLLQQKINPTTTVSGSRFKIGEKVIQNKNRYDLDILNGDIGFVRAIDTQDKVITVKFENPARLITLSLYENALDLAYAITCHKFQGSEARIIIVPIHRSQGPLILQRNWLYTAISRAQEVCVLVGQREQIPKIIRRNQQQRRYTRLAERLNE